MIICVPCNYCPIISLFKSDALVKRIAGNSAKRHKMETMNLIFFTSNNKNTSL